MKKYMFSIKCWKKRQNCGAGCRMVPFFMFVEMLHAWRRMSIKLLRTIAQDEGSMNEEDASAWIKFTKRKSDI